MPRFEDNIQGLISQDVWLNTGFNVSRPTDPIDMLIGDEKTNNIVGKWQTIASEYQIPVMAQFHGFDTEAQTTFRVPVDTHNIEKGLIKVKSNLSEKLRDWKRSGVQDGELYDYVFDDGIQLADQVITRTKVAKNEMLASGQATIVENDLNLTVDYGVPAENKAIEIDLDGDVTEQLENIVQMAVDRGSSLTGMYCGRKVLTKLRKHESIQKAINGTYGTGALVSNASLAAYLEAEYGISNIVTNDLVYSKPYTLGTDGRPVVTNERFYPDNKITFFGANPSGKIGTGLWGDPPEVDAGQFMEVGGSSVSPFVYISQWMEKDPAVLWTKASSLFVPVIYYPDSLYIATVKDGEGA